MVYGGLKNLILFVPVTGVYVPPPIIFKALSCLFSCTVVSQTLQIWKLYESFEKKQKQVEAGS